MLCGSPKPKQVSQSVSQSSAKTHATVGHSCGTFALVHALGVVGIAPKLASFFDACRASQPTYRTALFAQSKDIYEAHHNAITAGQTTIRESDWEDSDHFLSFVHGDIDGQRRLLEMDGNEPRDGPLDRGEATDSLLLVSAHGRPKLASCRGGLPDQCSQTSH